MDLAEIRERQRHRRSQFLQPSQDLIDVAEQDGDLLSSAGADGPLRRIQPGGLPFNDGFDRTQFNPQIPYLPPLELKHFPWVGIAGGKFDLFRSKSLDTTAVYGDAFLWVEPTDPQKDEAAAAENLPIYGSGLDGGSLTFASYTPYAEEIILTTAAIGSGSRYIGATCWQDPATQRVVSLFEDSSPQPWPGSITYTAPTGDPGTITAIPVGGRCFAASYEGSGFKDNSIGLDQLLTSWFYRSAGVGTQTSSSIYYEYFSIESIDRFNRTSTFTDWNETITPVLAGADSAIFHRQENGTFDRYLDTQSGQQFLPRIRTKRENNDDPDQHPHPDGLFMPERIYSIDLTKATSTETEERGVYPSLDYYLSAYDANADRYSDRVAISSVSAQVYEVSASGALPIIPGDSITLTITSGGYSGEEFRQYYQHVGSSEEQVKLTLYRMDGAGSGPATGNYVYNLAELWPHISGLLGSRIVIRERFYSYTQPTGFDAVVDEGYTVGDDPDYTPETYPRRNASLYQNTDSQVFFPFPNFDTGDLQRRILVEESPGGPFSSFRYTPNPRLEEENFNLAQYVLVSQSRGMRYFLNYVSSDIPFTTDPGEQDDSLVSPTRSTTGSQLTLTLTRAPEPITWDAVAGDIADMDPDTLLLYAANSIENGHLSPEYTQLYGNNAEFEFLDASGGSGGVEVF